MCFTEDFFLSRGMSTAFFFTMYCGSIFFCRSIDPEFKVNKFLYSINFFFLLRLFLIFQAFYFDAFWNSGKSTLKLRTVRHSYSYFRGILAQANSVATRERERRYIANFYDRKQLSLETRNSLLQLN